MDKTTKKIMSMREGGHVTRCHCFPHAVPYSVGKHTFDMLILLDALHPNPSVALYRGILMHDLAERWIGDLPGSVRRFVPELKRVYDESAELMDQMLGFEVELTDGERNWIKVLDQIEMFLWCQDQLNMGNENVGPVLLDQIARLREMALPQPCREFMDNFEWNRLEQVPDAD